MAAPDTARRRYAFDPLEQRGLLVGLSAGQLVSFGAGAFVAVAVGSALPGTDGLGVGAMLLAATALGSCWPVGGRPPLLWVPLVTSWVCRRCRGTRLAPIPSGHLWNENLVNGAAIDRLRDPRPCPPARAIAPGVRVVPLVTGVGQSFGAVRDLRSGCWSVVLAVRGHSFVLLEEDDQHRRLASWGSWLAGLARPGSPVVRVEWVERARATGAEGLARHLERHGMPEPEAARRSYAELIGSAGIGTEEHDTFVVLTFRPRRGRQALVSLRLGQSDVADVLAREARLLEGRLRGAQVSVEKWLSAAELAETLRIDTHPDSSVDGVSGDPWPQAVDEGWSVLRADGAWHTTYWVSEWPRLGVGPDFLAPLLLSGGRRRVSVILAPVSAQRAVRETQSARVADVADEELRSRAGFLMPARRRREAEGVLRREAELADGHVVFRFAAYVTVSEDDRAALEASCARIEHAAQQSQLELRRLYGRQAEAFGWTLPIGRGLA